MKTCRKCNLVKNKSEFYFDKSRSDGLCHVCKDCSSLIDHDYRVHNSKHFAEARANCRSVKRAYISEIKSNPCVDCGIVYQREAMTFDHRFDKKYDIFRLVDHPTASLEKLKNEIGKCDLVCVGCHRTRSHNRLTGYITTCREHRPIYHSGCKKCMHYVGLAKLRTKRVALIRQHKNQPCSDCGQKFESWKMDLDHIGKKSDNISNLVGSQASLIRILTELNQCEVVCCWCHVNRTVERRRAA